VKLQQYFQKPGIVIALIWIFLTAINIGKAFQMDDGFHLEAAQHIAGDPLHPMSGMIRWDYDEPEPMYKANQPPLLFYMIAGLSTLFGFNEIVMHLLIAVFSLLALYWFYKACGHLNVKRPLLLVALFGLCPAFVVSQNVMTDVPIMSLMIGAFYYLLQSLTRHENRNTMIAIVLLTIGMFIKYTVLPVLAAVALLFVLRKEYKKLLWLFIPILLIALWTLWNYWEFGGSHLFERKPGLRSTVQDRAWTYFSALGCIATFGALFLSYIFKGKTGNYIVYSITGLFLVVALLHYGSNGDNESLLTATLDISFFIHGLMIILVMLMFLYKSHQKPAAIKTLIQTPQAILILFTAALSSFLILFAPFMGIRHLLLIIPFLLLLAAPIIENTNRDLIRFSLTASIILSLLLGISDWKYAFYYKNTAQGIMKGMPPGSTVWATGTGAWQWYAQQNGMIMHTILTERGKPGDYLVIARGLPAYRVSPEKKFSLLAKIWGEPSLLSYFCVSDGASIYSSQFGKPAWKLSKRAIDTVYVCQYIADTP
jgi:4-amino-4-deoxy-L-arabinose transferase-like glycosyltransferase